MANPLVRLWQFIFGKPTFLLTIFMKSGSRIELDGVTDFHFKSQGSEVTYIRIEQSPRARNRLLVPAIALSQIEAVTRS